MNAVSRYIIGLLCVLSLTACKRSNVITTSGGRSYEVLVTGPDGQAVQAVADALRGITMSGLPQEEEAFDVSTLVKDELDQGTRYARNVILVSTDSTQLETTRIRYEQNVYARPQTIIHVDAPSLARLKADLPDRIKSLSDELTRAEMSNAIINLREHHNQEAERLIEAHFGCRLWVPEDLKTARQGKDFLWFTNNDARSMQNICVYRYAADSLRRQEFLRKRDSIMQVNISGETDSMHMRTVTESVEFRVKGEHDVSQLGARGLWQMEGDAMGGPFVSLSVLKGDSVVCVEGFVYAPGMRKRNMVRRLEAAICTLIMKE